MSDAGVESKKARWLRLSPLLDELLELGAPARAARLAALRDLEPALAEELQALLARDAELSGHGFLAAPALPPLLTQSLLAPGEVIGAYTLERELGHGGMGSVWLARRTDGRFEGRVALKFLASGLASPGSAERFAREGQILARLAHPHIARLLDAGVSADGRQPYLVLEYVEDGAPLDRFCAEHRLDTAARVRLFLDVLGAVTHAHNRLILHRDLKPGNILVDRQGQVKLLDFGIAKLLGDATEALDGAGATELTRRAGRAFTPQYAAPEQLQGGDVSTATDVYALGVLLYLLLSGGRHPTAGVTRSGEGALAQMRSVIEEEPRRLSEQWRAQGDERAARALRGDLDTIVAKALKKSPAERYANAAEMAEDLRRWLAHEPILARPDSRAYRCAKFLRRHRLAVLAGGAAVLALSSLTVLSVSEAWRADRAEGVARQRSAQADDLVGYMLGEFADKLRPIGRLELLDSVGSKALAHLSDGDAQQTPQARLQRAKALTVIGEVRVSKRELGAALTPLRAAQQLIEGEPPEPALLAEWRKAQGTAAFWIGHVHYTQRELQPALSAMQAYRDISARWLQEAPGQPEAMAELARAQTNLGVVLQDSGRLRDAAEKFERSIALKRDILSQRPQDQALRIDLANSMSWLGSGLQWQGEFERAQQTFAEGVSLITAVRAQAPREGDWMRQEARMRLRLAEALQSSRQIAPALRELHAAAELLRGLLTMEPGNQSLARELIVAEQGLVALSGQPARQRATALARLLERLDALDQGSPAPMMLRRLPERAQLTLLLAQASAEDGRSGAAIEMLQALQQRLTQGLRDRPDDLKLQAAWARSQLALLRQLRAARPLPEAQQACQSLIDGLSQMQALKGTHYEITEAWLAAQSCSGREDNEATRAARAWLASRR